MSDKFNLKNKDLTRSGAAQKRGAVGIAAVLGSLETLASDGIVYCAVSGGLDSMTLLYGAHLVSQRKNIELRVLHVNHRLRGRESDDDEALVRNFSRFLGRSCRVKRLRWKKGEKPSQATCRKMRQHFFRGILGPKDCLLLAHHLDDQAETVLLRLFRGSGLRGLSAMAPVSGPLRRPFLGLGKSALRAAAREWNLPWREDSSNQSDTYERNWLRRKILPSLEARRPGVAARLAALAAEARAEGPPRRDVSHCAIKGNRYFRVHDLDSFRAGDLSDFFRLDRRHALGLRRLIEKGGGAYSAEGSFFRLSAGILEESPATAGGGEPLRPARARGATVRSEFGTWRFRLRAGEKILFHGALGSKVKKEFQRAKVPTFFRGQIPILLREGRPHLEFSAPILRANALGAWWLAAQSIRTAE